MVYTNRNSLIKPGAIPVSEHDEYKEWAENAGNKYALKMKNTISETSENIFIDGQGFKRCIEEKSAVNSFRRILSLVCTVILLYIFTDHILPVAIGLIMQLVTGEKIEFRANGYMMLNTDEAYIVTVITSVLRYAVGILVAGLVLKMPPRLAGYRMPCGGKKIVGQTFGMALVAASVIGFISLLTVPSAFGYLSTGLIGDENGILDINNETRGLIVFSWIVIQSILAGMFYNSALFSALRQYGDIFAVSVAVFMEIVLIQSFAAIPAAIIISVIAGFSVARTKSVYVGIAERMIIGVVMALCYAVSLTDTLKYKAILYVTFALIFAAGTLLLIASGFFIKPNSLFRDRRKNVFTFRTAVSFAFDGIYRTAVVIISVLIFIAGCIL